MKARLGMTILSGSFILIHAMLLAFYFYLTFQVATPAEVVFLSIVMYIPLVPAALAIYWGFFIPEKLQEWTGILPPSFKKLKKKQERLKAMKNKPVQEVTNLDG